MTRITLDEITPESALTIPTPLNVVIIHLTVDFGRDRGNDVDTASQNIHPEGYNPALDSIRGIAVLFVILMHAEYYFFDAKLTWFPGGFLGVDLFFVLSGFLITHILLGSIKRRGRLNYKSFYLNRILRLFPALLLLLVIYYSYTLIGNQVQTLDLDSIFALIFYYFNWFVISTLRTPEGLGHMWSLAVEEQFYLLWPVLLAVLLKFMTQARFLVASLLIIITAIAVWRAYLWHIDTNWLFVYIRTDTRIDSILTGGFLAYLLSRNLLNIPNIRILSPVAASILLLSVLSFNRESPFLYMGGFTLIAILASVLIFHAVDQGGERELYFDWAILRWLGKISYGLYLWHMPIFSLVSTRSEIESSLWQATIAFISLIILTLLSWYLVERPFLRLKVRL